MAEVYINESILSNIANAIRSKNGETDLYTPNEFYEKIINFPTNNISADIADFIEGKVYRIYNSTVTSLRDYCFHYDKIATCAFPNCITIGYAAFYACTALISISFPKCTTICTFAFAKCNNLKNISFPKLNTIEDYAFSGCTNLQNIYLTNSTVCNIDGNQISNVFQDVVNFHINVPASLYNQYLNSPQWTYYYNKITSIPEST